jgi:tight adherence protein C
MNTIILLLLATLSIGTSVGVVVYCLAAIPTLASPRLGYRGGKRKQQLEKSGLFRLFEPLIRTAAAWISRLRIEKQREAIEAFLIQSGDYLGISPDEFFALSAFSALFFGAIGTAFSRLLNMGAVLTIIGVFVGGALPYMQIQGEMKRRFKEINRTLPAMIDLAALCMGAGSDFPGAIRLIVDGANRKRGATEEELARILQELDVGHTRRQALEEFLRRAPTESVRDFVGAVVQAEQKGNPLAEVLQIQAQVLRMHRSVAAEEAAARAGVLMMIPLLFLLCCILLVLLGPFIVNGLG